MVRFLKASYHISYQRIVNFSCCPGASPNYFHFSWQQRRLEGCVSMLSKFADLVFTFSSKMNLLNDLEVVAIGFVASMMMKQMYSSKTIIAPQVCLVDNFKLCPRLIFSIYVFKLLVNHQSLVPITWVQLFADQIDTDIKDIFKVDWLHLISIFSWCNIAAKLLALDKCHARLEDLDKSSHYLAWCWWSQLMTSMTEDA
jgi:hypothetical protein